jgi:citrate lyase subunit beta/citryl-CoA lyase
VTTAALAHVRSLLFAPGSDPRKLERALSSEADAIVADLEDSVVAAEKGRARDLLADLFAAPGDGPGRMVRVNGADTEYFEDDVEAVAGMQLQAVVLPKATPESVAALGPDGPPVVAIVETAQGVRLAYETASSDRVVALVLGAADLGAQLWLEPRDDNQELLYARSKLVVDSAAAGIRAPFDVVHLNVEDDAGMEAEALLARSLGLRGKACIHPRQVPVANRVFRPSDAEVGWAREVLAAYDEAASDGRGALVVQGALIDLALVQRARMIMATTEGAGT